MMGSKPFSISWDDVLSTLKGAAVAAAGGLVVWLANSAASLDMTTMQGVVLAAAASVAVNFLRKFITDTR